MYFGHEWVQLMFLLRMGIVMLLKNTCIFQEKWSAFFSSAQFVHLNFVIVGHRKSMDLLMYYFLATDMVLFCQKVLFFLVYPKTYVRHF